MGLRRAGAGGKRQKPHVQQAVHKPGAYRLRHRPDPVFLSGEAARGADRGNRHGEGHEHPLGHDNPGGVFRSDEADRALYGPVDLYLLGLAAHRHTRRDLRSAVPVPE